MARPTGPQRGKRHPKRRRGEQDKPALTRVRGTVKMNGDGSARLFAETRGTPNVYLPPEEIVGVRDGDVVTVELGVGRKGRVRGRIVERGASRSGTVVGVLRRQARLTYLLPDDGSSALVVPIDEMNGAKDGDAVEARILREGEAEGASVARVENVIGDPMDPRVQVEMAVRATKWPRSFDAAVDAEVALFPQVDPARVLVDGRRDLRSIPHVTIDGEDARDFDDAVSARPEGDRYRVWVSIADVSHYVREGTALDDAARGRTTSVYFPDRVLPMLPERLSNDLCSLRPNLPRLTMTAEMIIDSDGVMHDVQVYPSLIESAARLTYTVVQEVLDAAEVSIGGPRHPQAELIERLVVPARWLRAQRQRRGAIDFEIPESKIVIGPEGAAADIEQRKRLEAHRLIEDLMIAANEAVAEYLIESNWPALYRVHDSPDPAKLELLVRWSGKMGIPFEAEGARVPKELQRFLFKIRNHPAAGVVQSLVLRMMAQARYGPDNLGHYGLASKAYAHFTSPIRRYPDLVVHRSLKALWAGSGRLQNLDALGTHCSQQERKAMEAERGVTQLMACQIAAQHVGEDMEAVVTGVHPAGAFVRAVELFVDGLVPMEALSTHYRGYFEYVEDDQMLFSRRTKTKIQLGDRLGVQLNGVNMKRRQIDFAIAEESKQSVRREKRMGWKKDRAQEREVKHELRRGDLEPPHGRRGKADHRKPKDDHRRPTTDDRQPRSDFRRPGPDDRRPRSDNRRPTSDDRRPSSDNRPAPANGGRRPRSWEEQFLAPPSETPRPKRWEEMRERSGPRPGPGERERPKPTRYGMMDSDPYASKSSRQVGRERDRKARGERGSSSGSGDGDRGRSQSKRDGGRQGGRGGSRGPHRRR